MHFNTGKIYKINEENKPMTKTITESTVLDWNGYTLTFISMGCWTYVSPERVRHPAIYTVDQGEVIVSVRGDNPHEFSLKSGQFWFRRPDTLCGFRCEEDTVLCELTTHQWAKIAKNILDKEACNVLDGLEASEGSVVTVRLIDDPLMKLDIVAIGDGFSYHLANEEDVLMLKIEEGTGTLSNCNGQREIHEKETFYIDSLTEMDFIAQGEVKATIMKFPDADKFTENHQF